MQRYWYLLLVLALLGLLISPLSANAAAKEPKISQRPFTMGFSRWPPAATLEAFQMVDKFISRHADMVSLHMDNGIPWQESLDNKPYSADVNARLGYRAPQGYKTYVAITPLNTGRSEMAPYWGEKDNMPLPANWAGKQLNDPDVIKAYTNYALRVAQTTRPAYMVIGIEVNELLTNNSSLWNGYVELHKAVYTALKKQYPSMPVFASFNVLHWQGLAGSSDKKIQEEAIRSLMPYNDMVGISYYPYMSYGSPDPLPSNYLSFLKQYGKPIAVTETGYLSKNVNVMGTMLYGSEQKQKDYYDFLLKTATADNYVFVITFCTTDFEKLLEVIPEPMKSLASIWAYTGLQTSSGKAKPALEVWDKYFKAMYRK